MITRTLVEEKDRLNFLPKYLKSEFFVFEGMVYQFMDWFCENYNGGFWDFYELSNGGMYMSYTGEEPLKVRNDLNHFNDTMSPDAASIAINVFALYALIERNESDYYSSLYRKLRDYGMEHEEADKIYWLLD